jgi:hypothetical protein
VEKRNVRGWRKSCNEEFHHLCCSQDVIVMIKSRRMGWMGHVACVRKDRIAYRMLFGTPEGK